VALPIPDEAPVTRHYITRCEHQVNASGESHNSLLFTFTDDNIAVRDEDPKKRLDRFRALGWDDE
jgi:hypothetical protein